MEQIISMGDAAITDVRLPHCLKCGDQCHNNNGRPVRIATNALDSGMMIVQIYVTTEYSAGH
jgi:hypothetical protein